jgi:glycerate kinase
MRILVAPQELKGTLTAVQASEAIARGLSRARPDFELDIAPLADGGPGTVETFVRTLGGQQQTTSVQDPLGRPVEASWALLPDGTAVIEMAAASGLHLVSKAERDPLRSNSYGTGQLIRAALDAGARRIIVGAGGSATNDAGAGAAEALGVRFLDALGRRLEPIPLEFQRLARVEFFDLDPRLTSVPVEVITDVRNPLCGPEGASWIYGRQKGADEDTCARLDGLLAHFTQVVSSQTGSHLDRVVGAGAGGGLPFGLSALCHAHLGSGFETVSSLLNLFLRVKRSGVVITAEGTLDRQSAYVKVPFALARLARMQGRRVVIFVGALEPACGEAKSTFDEVIVVTPAELTVEAQRAQAASLLEAAAANWAASVRDPKGRSS